ncbi:MAG: hypothetical protein GY769_09020 [bacterium]|nr:hypothetical protein [bacterium]
MAAAVVTPWWGYCLSRFGTVVSDSGAAARQVVHAYQGEFLSPLSETLWATWTILGAPFVELRFVRLSLYSLAEDAHAVRLIACIAGAVLLLDLFVPTAIRIARSLDARQRSPFLVLVLHGAIIAAFYAYYVPVLWFFRRYTSPTAVVVTVLISVGAAWGWDQRARLTGRLALMLLGAGILTALVGVERRLAVYPRIAEDHAVDGATGYRAPTVELLAAIPPGSVVAGLQSGATSYFAPEDVTVHNLDGVVDRAAAAAFKEGELGALLRERNVTHFLDWELQHDMLVERAGTVPFTLETVATASVEQQSYHRLQLSEVRW